MITRDGKVRVSAKAILVRNGRLLLMRGRDRSGTYYLLPGGGQRAGETLREALTRECAEETGILVKPGRVRYVRDYIARNHEFAEWDRDFHQVEVMFVCSFVRRLGRPRSPDRSQTGFSWLPLAGLGKARLYPAALKELLSEEGKMRGPVYLGDVN
ncbi:MAG: NUDIX domain-containing protein [Elusimicrobia bacterium]|nr:NUDIX domain-containing protein [Elusimicrobiota bacterium]